jgi:hypothetical protein
MLISHPDVSGIGDVDPEGYELLYKYRGWQPYTAPAPDSDPEPTNPPDAGEVAGSPEPLVRAPLWPEHLPDRTGITDDPDVGDAAGITDTNRTEEPTS